MGEYIHTITSNDGTQEKESYLLIPMGIPAKKNNDSYLIGVFYIYNTHKIG